MDQHCAAVPAHHGMEPGGSVLGPDSQVELAPWGWRAGLRELPLVAAAALGLVLLILRPFPLERPVFYSTDAFQHLALVETSNWLGAPGASDAFGAPYGTNWALFPSGGERLHLVVLNALHETTGSIVAAANLYVALAILATAVITHTVLRWLGCRTSVAGAAACLFALSPAALQRLAVGHLFLFALFPVALGAFAVLWSMRYGSPPSWRPRVLRTEGWLAPTRWIAPVAAVAVTAVSSTYYAVFTALLLAACGLVSALRHGDPRRLAAPLMLLAVLGLATAATIAPDLLARRGDPAAAGFDRPVQDSESFGLRPAQMVLPRDEHPVPFLAELGERGARMRAGSDPGAVLGIAGTAGLITMALTVLRRAGRHRTEGIDGADGTDSEGTVLSLSTIAGSALFFATAGGGGFLLAVFGFTQLRVWSRFVVFVLFCSLATVGLLVQRRWGTGRRFPVMVAVVAVLALIDQGAWTPDPQANAAALAEDLATVEELSAEHSRGAVVAQLPVVPFPDHMGSERLLAPAIHADGALRFTAGTFRGESGDWQESWMTGDPDLVVRAAAAAGAEVLLVQRSHRLIRDADSLEAELSEASGSTVRRSDGGTWSWVDLRPLRERLIEEHGRSVVDTVGRAVRRPISLSYDGVASQGFSATGLPITYLAEQGALVLHRREASDTAAVQVRMRLHASPGTVVGIRAGEWHEELEPGLNGREVTIEVSLDERSTRLEIDSIGDEIFLPGSEGPALVQITDVSVRDVVATRSPVLR